MTELTLAIAQKIIADTFNYSRAKSFKPMAVAVLDARGALVAYAAEDGSSLIRWKIAFGKANGAISFGAGSRRLGVMATEQPGFANAVRGFIEGGVVPVAGGVLIRDAEKRVIGAIGVSGDSSDHDEEAGIAAITGCGLAADGG